MFFKRNKPALSGEYSVRVNPDLAFSIPYEDSRGKLVFIFEVDDTPKKVYLSPRPLRDGKVLDLSEDVTRAHVELAVGRVKTYFEDGGVRVNLQ